MNVDGTVTCNKLKADLSGIEVTGGNISVVSGSMSSASISCSGEIAGSFVNTSGNITSTGGYVQSTGFRTNYSTVPTLTSSDIGYSLSFDFPFSNTVGVGTFTVLTTTSLPKGIYSIIGRVLCSVTGAGPHFLLMSLSSTSYADSFYIDNTSSTQYLPISGVVSVSTSGSIVFKVRNTIGSMLIYENSSSVNSLSRVYITKIA